MGEIIKVENLSKIYRLGEIGSGTLRADLQSFFAHIFHKEDPNAKIGAHKHGKNEIFCALDDISFKINKGETVGIIGRNGAGKSTLLKVLSRITAPTSGIAYINGRVSSMLEIGTGFHPELTGRENIYLNGAILGMQKNEVDAKINDIIEFSECEKFIDTPIKRYSSGMYVKLAFAVAAHLDSEILIMDEVLSVGDVPFVRKCIEKMRQVAQNENRTILYVSHNMDTVKSLCTRTIVLQDGHIIFDGETDRAIELYLGAKDEQSTYMEFSNKDMPRYFTNKQRVLKLVSASYPSDSSTIDENGALCLTLNWENISDIDDLCFRLTVYDATLKSVATSVVYDFYSGKAGTGKSCNFIFDMSMLAPGRYETRYTFFKRSGTKDDIESFMGLGFYKSENLKKSETLWRSRIWGSVMLPSPKIDA